MDNALYYLAVNRQRGLAAEMATVAHNMANMSTDGYRREGLVFSEFVHARDGADSISMADLGVRYLDAAPGRVTTTAGALDVAIMGEGFFTVEDAAAGEVLLTRAGRFQRGPDGTLMTAEGRVVLDDGGAAILLPPEGEIAIAADGTLAVDGAPIARLGLATAPGPSLERRAGAAFATEEPLEPVPPEATTVRQGAIEGSNVDPIAEIARMIEVSRAYERMQGLVEDEDDRVLDAIRTLGEPV